MHGASRTLQQYAAYVHDHVDPYFGDLDAAYVIRQLKPKVERPRAMAVADWRAWLLAKRVMSLTGTPTGSTLSGKAVKNVMALVSSAFDVAMNDDCDRIPPNAKNGYRSMAIDTAGTLSGYPASWCRICRMTDLIRRYLGLSPRCSPNPSHRNPTGSRLALESAHAHVRYPAVPGFASRQVASSISCSSTIRPTHGPGHVVADHGDGMKRRSARVLARMGNEARIGRSIIPYMLQALRSTSVGALGMTSGFAS